MEEDWKSCKYNLGLQQNPRILDPEHWEYLSECA